MADAEFWYDFASSYSYPAAMRVEALAGASGVTLTWRPFLAGVVFAEFGWRDSPFNLYPAKGRYMWRDVQRVCDALALPLHRPAQFPQNSLLAARAALALDDALRPAFSRAVYASQFGKGRSIGAAEALAPLMSELGLAPEDCLQRANAPANKDRLRDQCAEAIALGLPGAPCLVTPRGEVFWGNDRLEQGIAWAAQEAL